MTDAIATTNDEEIKEILNSSKTIAVVGLSPKEDSPSNRVARYLKERGYTIWAVNPTCEEVLGGKCYPDLKSLPGHVDVVDIFRNISAIPGIVDEAIEIGAETIWMQLGLKHEEAEAKARAAGLKVVMDKCMKIEHSRISGE
ncbi:MAG: CoA-binding protein [Desulfobacteraceae bacterium]|nr:CoA-binding protein [Desulfobacteraceae bacterium]